MAKPMIIPAPPLVPPRGLSLVVAAGPNAAVGQSDRWVDSGLTFAPETGDLAGSWYTCPADDGDPAADKDPTGVTNPAVVEFIPWWVWHGDSSTSLDRIRSLEDGPERAKRALASRESQQIASELWNGTIAQAGGFPTPYLQDASLTALNGAGTEAPLVYAFGELAQAMSLASPGRGMIHVSPRAFVLLLEHRVVRRDGDLWLDGFDNIVVADAGYDGSGPDGITGGGDTEWFYGTDVVSVWRGEAELRGDPLLAQSAPYNDNSVTWLVEKPAAYTFSPVCQIGILADLCTVDCTPAGGGG